MGDKGGKTDMERMGIFQEMKYHTIGDKYTAQGGGKPQSIDVSQFRIKCIVYAAERESLSQNVFLRNVSV